jgi:shikimate dehydrogenase
MSTYGLIGYPLTHSFSKKYFDDKFRRENIGGQQYELWPIKSIDGFLPLIASVKGLKGINVTIPYKELVLAFLHELDSVAAEVKAVNCISVENGRLKGYNTDVIGLEMSLQKFITHKLDYGFILGTGGAAKAAMYVLKKLNIPFAVVSTRHTEGNIRYEDIAPHMRPSNLFINATPLGTFPDVDSAPEIPYSALTKNDYLLDLVYNPEETLFIKRGKERGAQTRNGQEVLEIQADKSWEIWNGV